MKKSNQDNFDIAIKDEMVTIHDKDTNIHINLSCDNMFGIFDFGAYIYSDEWGIGYDTDEGLV